MCLCVAALATEAPTPDLLLAKPHGRKEPIINRCMWKHIFTQGFYQLFWLFLIIYGANKYIARYALPSRCASYSRLDLSHGEVQRLTSVATQTGGLLNTCCSGEACFKSGGGIYLTGRSQSPHHHSAPCDNEDASDLLNDNISARCLSAVCTASSASATV